MNHRSSCVLLADRHHGLRDSVRGLLETVFESVFMVADEASVLEGAERLKPAVVVFDLALAGGDLPAILKKIRARSPDSKILLLSVYDEPNVADTALAAGANGIVLKHSLATDLMTAIETVLAGRQFRSPAIG